MRSTGRGRSRSSLGVAGSCSRRAAISQGALRELRARARRARSQPGSVPTRADAARPRQDAAAGEEARRRPHDARGCARTLRTSRRAALGRAGSRRAGANRRPSALAGRADRGRAPDRRARRPRPHEPRGGGCPLPHRTLRRDRTDARLPQARRAFPRRARAPPRFKQLRFPAFAGGRALPASSLCRATSSRRTWLAAKRASGTRARRELARRRKN